MAISPLTNAPLAYEQADALARQARELVKVDTDYGPAHIRLEAVDAITAPFPYGKDYHLVRAILLRSGGKVHFSDTPANLALLTRICPELEPMPKPKAKAALKRKAKSDKEAE